MAKGNNNLFFEGKGRFSLKDCNTTIALRYKDEDEYKDLLKNQTKAIDKLQEKLFAERRQSLLIVLQAFDAAGKDGTIRAVLKGLNPAGVSVKAFKRPSETEINHDFLWRCVKELPERGQITVFNRSFYEEVLVVKVHENIVTVGQRLPVELTQDMNKLFQNRYKDIVNFEEYLNNNGTQVLKIFLNVSKEEQANRQIERINNPEKTWKFEPGDIKERGFWNEYQKAYEQAINETATSQNPWNIVPADDKMNMRLIVSELILNKLKEMNPEFPVKTDEELAQMQQFIAVINEQNNEK